MCSYNLYSIYSSTRRLAKSTNRNEVYKPLENYVTFDKPCGSLGGLSFCLIGPIFHRSIAAISVSWNSCRASYSAACAQYARASHQQQSTAISNLGLAQEMVRFAFIVIHIRRICRVPTPAREYIRINGRYTTSSEGIFWNSLIYGRMPRSRLLLGIEFKASSNEPSRMWWLIAVWS